MVRFRALPSGACTCRSVWQVFRSQPLRLQSFCRAGANRRRGPQADAGGVEKAHRWAEPKWMGAPGEARPGLGVWQCADLIDHCRPLANQTTADAVEGLQVELFNAL